MKKIIISVLIVVLLLFVVGAYVVSALVDKFEVDVKQPIEFNHKLHVVDKDIECIDCHQFYDTQKNSGRPTLEICMGCHEDDESDHSEMKKLMEYAEKDMEIPWKRIYTVPTHVYFSHRMHTTQEPKVECTTCHGEIGSSEAPPNKPLVLHTMDFCLNCHKKMSVSQDCLACHN